MVHRGNGRVGSVLRAAGRTGDATGAIESVVGIDAGTLSEDWHRAIADWVPSEFRPAAPEAGFPAALIGEQRGRGSLNVGPALSPDGTRIVFLSERDLFSIELFLADAATGRVIRKITSTATDPHFDSLQFVGSAGASDPSGARFAFATDRCSSNLDELDFGRYRLAALDMASGRVEPLPGPATGK